MKRFLKSNKGITGADAVLGVALAILFWNYSHAIL